jgi:hypothetical protein
MSVYILQKMIRDVNRYPDRRAAFFASKEVFVAGYELSEDERDAVLNFDIGKLYALGVHGLILRPFTLLHKMPEPDYLVAIRRER